MATFKNISAGTATLTDENGINKFFGLDEEISGLSNYFYKYTESGGSSRPALVLVGSLSGDGSIPAPQARNMNLIENPGQPEAYSRTASLSSGANPAVIHPTFPVAPGAEKAVFDTTGETAGERRRINTAFVGVREVPTERRESVDLAGAALNAACAVAAIGANDIPLKSNGLQASAADAAANGAVSEGSNYTAFGVIDVIDLSPSQTKSFYFSIQGTSTFVFVSTTPLSPGAITPVAAGSSINLTTGVITLATMTAGAAGDSVSVDVSSAVYPDTAAKMEAVVDGLKAAGQNVDGIYIQSTTGDLYVVSGDIVNNYAPTAQQSIS